MHGSMTKVLITGRKDRRADQQHRRQIHEGAEQQQENLIQSRNMYLSLDMSTKNWVASAGTCMIAIM